MSKIDTDKKTLLDEYCEQLGLDDRHRAEIRCRLDKLGMSDDEIVAVTFLVLKYDLMRTFRDESNFRLDGIKSIVDQTERIIGEVESTSKSIIKSASARLAQIKAESISESTGQVRECLSAEAKAIIKKIAVETDKAVQKLNDTNDNNMSVARKTMFEAGQKNWTWIRQALLLRNIIEYAMIIVVVFGLSFWLGWYEAEGAARLEVAGINLSAEDAKQYAKMIASNPHIVALHNTYCKFDGLSYAQSGRRICRLYFWDEEDKSWLAPQLSGWRNPLVKLADIGNGLETWLQSQGAFSGFALGFIVFTIALFIGRVLWVILRTIFNIGRVKQKNE